MRGTVSAGQWQKDVYTKLRMYMDVELSGHIKVRTCVMPCMLLLWAGWKHACLLIGFDGHALLSKATHKHSSWATELLQLLLTSALAMGALQVVEATFNCYSFSLYWLDIMSLALQQAGGTPGPAAVAAARQLMKEKHSVFVAR
jgi:hypothetical protein